MATKKQILESDELLQQKRKAYHLSDEGFEEYKKFLSDPDQLYIKSIIIFIPFNEIVYMAYVGRSSCQLIQFIRHDNFQRPYFVGFGRQNSATILHRILINAYICIHS